MFRPRLPGTPDNHRRSEIRRPLTLTARRLGQTRRTFHNHRQVLSDLLFSTTPWRRDELVFELRNGLTIRCPNVAGARVPVYELFAEDTYRIAECVEGLPTGFAALDIGAQIGCFSMALCQARPDVRLHSYEASPVTARWLTQNLSSNGFSQAAVHAVAVSDHRGTLEFRDNGSGSGLNGLTAAAESGSVVKVPCVTFADAVADLGGTVDLVKLDTEGAEYDIVLGSEPGAWAGVHRVVLEYHDVPGHGWPELKEFFARAGLVETRHESVTPGWGGVWLTRAG